MNCSQWEERIALYAGGDLRPEEAAEVERHLGDCPGCQVFASGLMESMELLQEAQREPIAAADLAAVRSRVMAAVEEAGRPWWRRAWVYGLAAVAAALFLMMALRPGAPERPRRAAVNPPPPQVEVQEVVTPPPIHRARAVRRRPRRFVTEPTAQSEPGPPVVVKLLTDDPDVVIYWITDKSGE